MELTVMEYSYNKLQELYLKTHNNYLSYQDIENELEDIDKYDLFMHYCFTKTEADYYKKIVLDNKLYL